MTGFAERNCFLEPIPEIFTAANAMKEAVAAHQAGDRALCSELIHLANNQAVRTFMAPFLGPWRQNPHLGLRKLADVPKAIPQYFGDSV